MTSPTETDILYICGGPASGKSTLGYLLDGHPEVMVSFFHDQLISTYSQAGETEELRDRMNEEFFDILAFRDLVSNSGYYKLQRISEGVMSQKPFARDEKLHLEPDGFDFYDFERQWLSDLNQSGDFTPENVLTTIYKHMFLQWNSSGYNPDTCQYFAGMGTTHGYEYLLENTAGGKIIYVERDPRGIVATRAGPVGNKNMSEKLRTGSVYSLNESHRRARFLEETYPGRVLVVGFEELILDTSTCMESIAAFLDIAVEDTLFEPTFGREPIAPDQQFIGEINDDWPDLLTEREIAITTLQHEGIRSLPQVRPSLEEFSVFLQSYLRWKFTTNLRPRLIDFGKQVLGLR